MTFSASRAGRVLRPIGVPLDLGQNRRGVDMGPSAIRYAGLAPRLRRLGYSVEDGGNLEVAERETLGPGGVPFLAEVARVCGQAYRAGRDAVAQGLLPIFLGGDHSISAGTVAGISDSEPVGLLWVDAHADFNTFETSPSGNLHGMPLAALLGRGAPELVDIGRPGPKIEPRDVVLIGLRDIDAEERVQLKASGILVFTMREIDELGVAVVARQAIERLRHRSRLHLSLDMDVLDPSEAPGVGTPVVGGLSYREAHLLMEMLAETGAVGSVDVVEVNPMLDSSSSTAKLAVELLASLLGSRIL